MSSTTKDNSKLKVFISYSRKDLDFADQLVAVLRLHDFEPSIDRAGIHGAENWEQRLGQLILEADIVVFVLSPDSAKSDICAWEVDEAARRGKQIIPVLCRPLEDNQPHKRLRDLNYIFFYSDPESPGSGFGTGQARLIDALSVDVAWLREHTRLGELAQRWQTNNQPTDLLVRGSELTNYKSWRDTRPSNAPDLTDQQRNFLAASEEAQAGRESTERKQLEDMKAAQAEKAKALEAAAAAQKKQADASRRLAQRTVLGLITAAVLVVLAGAAGVLAFRKNQEAQTALNQAAINESRNLANLAANEIKNGDIGTGILLALEAMPDYSRPTNVDRQRPYWQRAEIPLDRALRKLRERKLLKGHTGEVSSVAVTPDGQRIVTGSDDKTVRVWDAASGAQLAELKGHTGAVSSVAVTPDGKRIVTGSDDKTVRVWDAASGAQVAELKGHTGRVYSVAVTPDGKRIVTGSWDNTVRVWPFFASTKSAVLRGKEVATRCLTPAQREQFHLDPEPPAWCIEKKLWPYHDQPKPESGTP